MMTLTALYLFILVMEIVPTEQKLYFSKSGEVLGESILRTVYNIPIQDCRAECMARPACVSVNYFRSLQKCELNTMAVGAWNVAEKTGSVFSEKTDWTDAHFENCSCALGKKCVVTSVGHTCVVKECDRLPTKTLSNMNNVGARADINVQCMQDTNGLDTLGAGGTPDTTRATMTCNSDGTWKIKTPTGDRCLVVAFVMVPGTGQDLFIEWASGTSSSSEVTWNQYYRNGVIDIWSMLTISHVRFSIFKNLQEVKYVVFNGTGSTSVDWFAQSRVIDSSWNDLSYASYNFFGASGYVAHAVFIRRFYMNRFFYGCLGDVGWFVVVVDGFCAWELGALPVFIYSKSDAAGLMASQSEHADYVYITLYLDTDL